jgi:hypothetical protein
MAMTIIERSATQFVAHGIETIKRAARARGYFFMPSLSALRWIGNLAETHSIEQKER